MQCQWVSARLGHRRVCLVFVLCAFLSVFLPIVYWRNLKITRNILKLFFYYYSFQLLVLQYIVYVIDLSILT